MATENRKAEKGISLCIALKLFAFFKKKIFYSDRIQTDFCVL